MDKFMPAANLRPGDYDFGGSVVLVTGATGFLGRHLVSQLVRSGACVYATTHALLFRHHDPVRWIAVDLSNAEALSTTARALQPDFVFHLGGRVSAAVEPELVTATFDTLLASSITLLAAAQAGAIGRLVLVGSTDEPHHGEAPASPYGAAKAAMMDYGRLYARSFDTPVVAVRPAETYGPGQARNKLLPYTVAAALQGVRPRLSSGRRRGDWVHVDDVVDGMLAAARHASPGDEIDLGTGTLHSNREVVETLLHALEVEVEPMWGAVPDRPNEPERAADVERAARILGWRSRVPLTDGLHRMAADAHQEMRKRCAYGRAG